MTLKQLQVHFLRYSASFRPTPWLEPCFRWHSLGLFVDLRSKTGAKVRNRWQECKRYLAFFCAVQEKRKEAEYGQKWVSVHGNLWYYDTMFFDTHVHFETFDSDYGLFPTVDRALKADVDRMIAVGGSADMNKMAVEAARSFPSNIRAAIGFDRDNAANLPNDAMKQTHKVEAFVAQIESEVSRLNTKGPAVIAAIGEIGLDFHYSPETAQAQIGLFREQLALAGRLNLPVIVHSRDADEATLAELRRHADNWTGEPARIGVLHCFTRSESVAAQLLDMGFHISFSGILTFGKASALREIAKVIPEDRLLIETDSPYLAPVPHRGKRCEPMYVRHVAETLANIRGCSVEEIAKQTGENAGRLFGFPAATP